MPLRDYPSSDPFENQDVIPYLTTEELRELSNLKELTRSNIATMRYFEERGSTIFKAAKSRQGGGVDASPIITKLKITILQLFEICNQSIACSYVCPSATNLTGQMEGRLHACIDTLSQIIDEIKPKRVDPLPLPPDQAGPVND